MCLAPPASVSSTPFGRLRTAVISVLRWRFSLGTFDRIASTYFFLLGVSTARHRRSYQLEVRCVVTCRVVARRAWANSRSALDSKPLGFTRELQEVMVVEEPDEGESWKVQCGLVRRSRPDRSGHRLFGDQSRAPYLTPRTPQARVSQEVLGTGGKASRLQVDVHAPKGSPP